MQQAAIKKGSWTELEKETVYDNPWIEVTESRILNPNGGKGIYGKVHFKNLAIGIIPLDENNHTWIVGQDRFPFDGAFSWEIIEGGGPLDVDPLVSAKRELLEEAGLKAGKWDLIQEMHLSNSVSDEIALIYVARDLTFHQQDPDGTELLQLQELPFGKLYDMVVNGTVKDSMSVAGVLKVKLMMDEGKI